MGLEMRESQTVPLTEFVEENVLRAELQRHFVHQIDIFGSTAQSTLQEQRDRPTNGRSDRLLQGLA